MSAKQGLLRWLAGFMAFDVVILGALLSTQLDSTQASAVRITGALTTFLAPPALLLLNAIIPQKIKHCLVFWRIEDVLPSHRAFSTHAQDDPRINLQKLKRKLGEFPVSPRDQQDVWFGIYQAHKADAAVVDSHRLFLIFRDLAVLSLEMAIVVPALLCVFGHYFAAVTTLVVFVAQYLLAAIASRQTGVRLVCTVLSLESHVGASS